jgi:hypothetical protein
MASATHANRITADTTPSRVRTCVIMAPRGVPEYTQSARGRAGSAQRTVIIVR